MLKEVNHEQTIQQSSNSNNSIINNCPELNLENCQSDESKTKESASDHHHKDCDLDDINSLNKYNESEWSSIMMENNLNIDNISFPVYQNSNEIINEVIMENPNETTNQYLENAQDHDSYTVFHQDPILHNADDQGKTQSDKGCHGDHSIHLDQYNVMNNENVAKTEIIDNKPQNSCNTTFTTNTVLSHPFIQNYNVSSKRQNFGTERYLSNELNSVTFENDIHKNEEKKDLMLIDDQLDVRIGNSNSTDDKNVEYYQLDNAMMMNGFISNGITATAYNPQSIIIIPQNYEFSQNIIKGEFINASNNILEPCLIQDYNQNESENISRGYNYGVPVPVPVPVQVPLTVPMYSTIENQMQYNISNDLGINSYMQLNSLLQNNNTIIGMNEGMNEDKIYLGNSTISENNVKSSINISQEHNVIETKKRKRNKKRENLPKEATAILKKWLLSHMLLPYPGIEEKILLCKATKLTLNQVNNWFINARVRIWKPVVSNLFFKYENHLRELELDDQNKNQLKRIQEYSKISTMNMVSLLSGLSEARRELDEISKDLVANIKLY